MLETYKVHVYVLRKTNHDIFPVLINEYLKISENKILHKEYWSSLMLVVCTENFEGESLY